MEIFSEKTMRVLKNTLSHNVNKVNNNSRICSLIWISTNGSWVPSWPMVDPPMLMVIYSVVCYLAYKQSDKPNKETDRSKKHNHLGGDEKNPYNDNAKVGTVSKGSLLVIMWQWIITSPFTSLQRVSVQVFVLQLPSHRSQDDFLPQLVAMFRKWAVRTWLPAQHQQHRDTVKGQLVSTRRA